MDTSSHMRQAAMHEWLRSDAIGIDQVKEACDLWDQMVQQLSEFALNRYGRRNNNWLKIIPLMMHEMAGDITRRVEGIRDVTIRHHEHNDWQDTFWNTWEQDTPELRSDTQPVVDIDKMSHDQIGKRLKQLHEDAEVLDPFYVESMKEWARTQEQTKPEREQESEIDEDLLM